MVVLERRKNQLSILTALNNTEGYHLVTYMLQGATNMKRAFLKLYFPQVIQILLHLECCSSGIYSCYLKKE